MIGSSRPTIGRKEILDAVSESEIAGFYLGIRSLPSLISSPLRKDEKPSFVLYSPDATGHEVNYRDYATNESGSLMNLLMKMFSLTRSQLYTKIQGDMLRNEASSVGRRKSKGRKRVKLKSLKDIQVKIRDWQSHDTKYWESYGVSLKWLKWAGVYPISHKILLYDDGSRYVFGAARYAYAFFEHKEGHTTVKIYQPFSKEHKWTNCHDKSVLGLWAKLPAKGKSVCICSSVKDALCLMSQMRMPSICVQGEAMSISEHALYELRQRFRDIYVCYDNDKSGIADAAEICPKIGAINIEIPQFEGGKDISDAYKILGKEKFYELFKRLIIESRNRYYNELPF